MCGMEVMGEDQIADYADYKLKKLPNSTQKARLSRNTKKSDMKTTTWLKHEWRWGSDNEHEPTGRLNTMEGN